MSSTNDLDLDDVVKQLQNQLEPLGPKEGVERYLNHRAGEITPNTKNEYQAELNRFGDFCDREDITNLNDLSGRDIDKYQNWRRKNSTEGNEALSTKTMRDVMYLLRSFVDYLSSIEAVPSDLTQKIKIPDLAKGDGVRNTEIDTERLNRVIKHLRKHEYASREHVVWILLALTGRRLGGIHSLDLKDLHLNTKEPYLEFRHNPPGTRLKNGEEGEGQVNISQRVVDVLQAYIHHNRIETDSETGRKPLLTTPHGRISKSAMRGYIYKWSRPCKVGQGCPHGRDPEDCKAAQSHNTASQCPSSRSAHTLRHTYLTQKRRDAVPKNLLSDRCDVSEEILDKHYDERTSDEKRERRRKVLNELRDDTEGDLL